MLAVVVLFTTTAHGQQEAVSSFFVQNSHLYNPAWAHDAQAMEINVMSRSQWANVANAPNTQLFQISKDLGNNVGLGLLVVNDQVFVEKQTVLGLDFSYKLQVSDAHDLYFGLRAGGSFYRADVDQLRTFSMSVDPALVNINRFIPNIGAGLHLQHQAYFVSLGLPRLFAADRVSEEQGVYTDAKQRPHAYVMGGYYLPLANNWEFQPSSMLSYVPGAPVSVHLNAMFSYNNTIDFGVGYTTNETLSGMVLWNVPTLNAQVGYAYDSSLVSSLNSQMNGSHELVLKIRLQAKN